VPIIKKILKERGFTYADLAKKLNMSEANIKKMMIARDCSIGRLNKICEVLDLSLLDLLEILRKHPVRSVQLSSAQQTLLTGDETVLLLYCKIAFENVLPREAKAELHLSDVAFEKGLLSLEKVGLLKKNAKGKFVVPEEHIGLWSDQGVLSRWITTEWTQSILRAAVGSNPGSSRGLRYFRLTEKSTRLLRTRIAEVFNDFERISALETKMESNLRHVSCVHAMVLESPTNIRFADRGKAQGPKLS